MSQDKAAFFDFLFKFFVSIYCRDFRIAVIQCFFVDICLNFFEQFLNVCFDAIASHSFFFQCITAHYFHCIVFEVTSSHHQTNRDTFQFIICEFEARTFVVRIVIFHRNAQCFQFGNNAFHFRVDLFQLLVVLIDRNDYYLNRS